MRESAIEKYLVKRVKEYGGECIKFVSPGRRAVPDRLVVWPGGRIHMVETKAPGRKLRPEQKRFARLMYGLRVECIAADTKEAVDGYVNICVRLFRLEPRSRSVNKGKKLNAG